MRIAYFGCWEQSGHYLWLPGKRRVWGPQEQEWPRDFHLDGGILFLPKPERVGVGEITYLPAPNITVLAWWGSPWDKRGAVNSAVLLGGNHPAIETIWTAFEHSFPDLAAKLSIPRRWRESTAAKEQ